jgi:hypothetical protein
MMHSTSPAPTGNLQEPHIQGKGENRFKVVQVQGENTGGRVAEIIKLLRSVKVIRLPKQKGIGNCLEWVLRNLEG